MFYPVRLRVDHSSDTNVYLDIHEQTSLNIIVINDNDSCPICTINRNVHQGAAQMPVHASSLQRAKTRMLHLNKLNGDMGMAQDHEVDTQKRIFLYEK